MATRSNKKSAPVRATKEATESPKRKPATESPKRKPAKKPIPIPRAKRGAGATVENVVQNKRTPTSYAAENRSVKGPEAHQQKLPYRLPQPRKK
jgi:hypothetical protein